MILFGCSTVQYQDNNKLIKDEIVQALKLVMNKQYQQAIDLLDTNYETSEYKQYIGSILGYSYSKIGEVEKAKQHYKSVSSSTFRTPKQAQLPDRIPTLENIPFDKIKFRAFNIYEDIHYDYVLLLFGESEIPEHRKLNPYIWVTPKCKPGLTCAKKENLFCKVRYDVLENGKASNIVMSVSSGDESYDYDCLRSLRFSVFYPYDKNSDKIISEGNMVIFEYTRSL